MTSLTIRNLPDAVYRALCVRAADHGHSIEAEILNILEAAVLPPERVKLGSLLTSIAREAGGLTEDEVAAYFDRNRDKAPAKPLGSLLCEIGREIQLTEEEFAIFASAHARAPAPQQLGDVPRLLHALDPHFSGSRLAFESTEREKITEAPSASQPVHPRQQIANDDRADLQQHDGRER